MGGLKRVFWNLFKFVFGLVVIAVLFFALLGFVPGLSPLFGSDKPKDLGVSATAGDLKSAQTKTGIAFVKVPAAGVTDELSIKFSGKTAIKNELTSEELTALLQNDDWKNNFIQDGQVRINPDRTVELSGILRVDRLPGYLRAHGVSGGNIEQVLSKFKDLPANPPFLMKVAASWQDNNLTLDVQQLRLGRLPVPPASFGDTARFVQAIEDHVLGIPNLTVKSMRFEDGKMKAEGTFPKTVEWAVE